VFSSSSSKTAHIPTSSGVSEDVLKVKYQLPVFASETDTNTALRLITSVDNIDYRYVQFKVGYTEGGNAKTREFRTKNVYSIVKGNVDGRVTINYSSNIFSEDSAFLMAVNINKIPKDVYDSGLIITPQWITLDGTRVDGEIAVKTVNYGRAWYYVDVDSEATNIVAPKGTASNPYKTLADAVAVETTLNPKLILKSDVTVDATVNIERTMTIESFDEAKTITYSDTTKNIMEVAENGNLTLNKLNLNGGYRAVNNVAGTVTATNVIIEGATHCGLYIDNGGYASLSNVEIKGGQRGIQLYDGGDLEGNVVKIYSPTLYGIACGNDGNDGDSINTGSSFDIEDLTVNGSTSHAVNVYGKSEVKITKGEITNSKGHGVNVQASTATLNDVDIIFDENTTGDIQGLYAYKEATLGASTVYLNNVTIKNAPTNGIQIYQGSNVIGKTVTITSPGTYGIKCGDEGSSFNVDTLNVSDSGSIGLNVYSSATGTVNNGTITDSGSYGVNVDSSATVSVTGGTITDSSSQGVNVNGASIVLTDVQINNSEKENLYLSNASSATVNGTLTTQGGTHALAIYKGSTVVAGADYEKIDIGAHSGIGVRIYNTGSRLDVADMDITGGTNGIELDAETIVNLTGNINLSGMTGNNDDGGNGIFLKYAGTLNAVNAAITINNVGYNAVYMKAGTINASTSVINIKDSGNYGLRANGESTSTIGTLNVTGTNGFAAVRVQDTAKLTVNGGTIKDSNRVGINTVSSGELTLNNVTIQNSGTSGNTIHYHDIYKEGTKDIDLTTVTYTTKNY